VASKPQQTSKSVPLFAMQILLPARPSHHQQGIVRERRKLLALIATDFQLLWMIIFKEPLPGQ
jgi:hypothetical protein